MDLSLLWQSSHLHSQLWFRRTLPCEHCLLVDMQPEVQGTTDSDRMAPEACLQGLGC